MNKNYFSQVQDTKESYCGIGMRKVKNKLIKHKDSMSKILLLILEIEDCSIFAKTLYNEIWKDYHYQRKDEMIRELIILLNEENITYGFVPSDIPKMDSIIFIDLPCGQISWHSCLDHRAFPVYNSQWDGKRYSTFSKLEKCLSEYL